MVFSLAESIGLPKEATQAYLLACSKSLR